MKMKMMGSIYCAGCGRLIGDMYEDGNGRLYVAVGDVLARVFIHNCKVCKRQFHWHSEQEERQRVSRANKNGTHHR